MLSNLLLEHLDLLILRFDIFVLLFDDLINSLELQFSVCYFFFEIFIFAHQRINFLFCGNFNINAFHNFPKELSLLRALLILKMYT
jgi:hypothetical protein